MKKSKLIISMYIVMIALGVVSVSMSIAWYATSRTLFVNSIDISIDTDRELLISESIDGEYSDHISHTEREANGVFVPVTSAHSSLWMSQKPDMPVFYDETRFSEEESANLIVPATHGYFSQKFYLKSDDNVYVTIDPELTKIDPNKDFNPGYAEILYNDYQALQTEGYKDFSKEEINEMLDRLVKSMRYSILINDENEYSYTIIDPDRENHTATKLGGLLDNDVDQFYDFYKKDGTDEYCERLYGEIIGNKEDYVYFQKSDEDSGFDEPGLPSAFNAKHKKDVRRLDLESTLSKVEIKEEEAINVRDFENEVKPFYFPVYRDRPKEVVVSIYIEGWDLESVNYTMGASFVSDLSFKIYKEMTML